MILLTGGAFEVDYGSLAFTAFVGLALITVGRLSQRRILGDSMATFAGATDSEMQGFPKAKLSIVQKTGTVNL